MPSTRPGLPPPSLIGLPERFTGWRDYQEQAVLDLADALDRRRFAMAVLPTGAGKSLIYVALASLLGVRAAALTRTKALQDQLTEEFREMGLASVRGANAYTCQALLPGGEHYDSFESATRASRPAHLADTPPTCDEGPCRHGVSCSLREGGCGYFDAISRATHETVTVTNYAFWMYQHRYGRGLGTRDLLILDEAHDAPDALSDFLTVVLEPWMVGRVGGRVPEGTPDAHEWAEWGGYHLERAEEKLTAMRADLQRQKAAGGKVRKADLDEVRILSNLVQVLEAVASVDETWVYYYRPESRSWLFAPAWPAPYAEKSLFLNRPKILLVSATVRPKTAWYLGIPEDQLTMKEYPSTFPKARRPVYYLPTVRVDRRMTDGMRKLWVRQIDRILERRADRKGLIHTVSYERAREIQRLSEYGDRMLVHGAEGTRSAIARFREADQDSGLVLVSPSITTGYDFKFTDAEFQIITKVPFPHTTDPLMKARAALDPDYPFYHTLQTLVQSCGRIVRDPADQGETFIIDDHLRWALWKYKHLVPQWFLDSVQTATVIPAAPPRLVPTPKAAGSTRS